jgi:hypothetical protein
MAVPQVFVWRPEFVERRRRPRPRRRRRRPVPVLVPVSVDEDEARSAGTTAENCMTASLVADGNGEDPAQGA